MGITRSVCGLGDSNSAVLPPSPHTHTQTLQKLGMVGVVSHLCDTGCEEKVILTLAHTDVSWVVR